MDYPDYLNPFRWGEFMADWMAKRFGLLPSAVITILAFVGSIWVVVFATHVNEAEAEAKRKQTLDYQTQLAELARTESSLRTLTEFVLAQKTKLKESEDLIVKLKSEQERLKPVVEADRQVVQAVFDLQEERTRRSIWTERWIGFAVGVISSIIASAIFEVILRWHRGKSVKAPPSATKSF